MISIIIPAHNEQGVIGRCLRAMSAGAREGELQIIVVCNGCSDRTAEAARSVDGPIEVLETEIASKIQALNMGDEAARGFPRFYVDADVVVSLEAIRCVADILGQRGVLAAAPRMRFTFEQSSWAVKAFYDIWTRLPYYTNGIVQQCYALTREGRTRFGRFPPITSDDVYVRLQFRPEQRATVEACDFKVTPPKTLWNLIKIKTRSQFGAYELRAKYPELLVNDPRNYKGALVEFLKRPGLWPSLAVYCLVLFAAKARVFMRFVAGKRNVWDRDDSSRAAEPPDRASVPRDRQDGSSGGPPCKG